MMAYMLRKLHVLVHDSCKRFLGFIRLFRCPPFKRRRPTQELVQQHAQRPDVGAKTVFLFGHHLGGQVVQGATQR